MSRPSNILLPVINYGHPLVLSVELINKSWVLAAQVPGLPRTKAQRTIEPNKNALLATIDGYRAPALLPIVGYTVDRVITTYEAGWSGFWLARWLVAQGVEVHALVQPSRAYRVDRRLRRGAREIGWHRCAGNCSCALCLLGSAASPACVRCVPIPDEPDEDARRCGPRTDRRAALRSCRPHEPRSALFCSDACRVNDHNPLLQSRRRRLAELQTNGPRRANPTECTGQN